MGDGWIKLHRKTLENPIICKDAEHMAVWIFLLLNATHSPQQKLFGGNKIILNPGQLITGRKAIAEAIKVSESKVQRILKLFENEQQIEQQTSTKNRLVTVLNWGLYQESEQQVEQQLNNKRTTTEQQLNTNKNERKKECKKDIKKNVCFAPPSVEDVRQYCLERNNQVSPDNFVNFYSSKGWMVGKNKMKDWKAAVRTWEQKDRSGGQKPQPKNKFINFEQRGTDYEALLKKINK